MIYKSDNNCYLDYSTPLIEYIRKKNLYINEKLIYTKRYTDGTFSITNPTNKYINCEQVNGYPHFHIPLNIILDEIYFFIHGLNMYNSEIFIRYGDVHPHKVIPKLAQLRNIIIDNSLNAMIGVNAKSYFVVGDISIKSLNEFSKKYCLGVSGEELFIDIVNNKLDTKILKLLNQFNIEAAKELTQFLNNMKLCERPIILESELYKDQELYQKFKRNSIYGSELKKNGELKYTLQEMMFICSILKNNQDLLINIIGSNQSDHIKKVNNILSEFNQNLDVRFLSYGMCNNGDSTDVNEWSTKLLNYITSKKLTQNGKEIDYKNFLKALMIVNSNDIILDFNNLEKHTQDLKRFNNIIDSICRIDENNKTIKSNNDLLCMMALVGYTLNRSVENGNQNMFYKYLLSIANEFETHKEKYQEMSGLYHDFMVEGFKRIGYSFNNIEEINERKMLKCSIQKV